VVALVGGALGAVVGNNRAFALRLMAQTALCQMQIERNTRPAAVGSNGQIPGRRSRSAITVDLFWQSHLMENSN